MKNARGSCCSVQNRHVQPGVTFHVSDFQLLRLSFNDTCSRQAGVAVTQARCILEMFDWHIDRVIGYPVRCSVVFASISRRLPRYYTSLQRPFPSKSSSIHSWNHLVLLRFSHESQASSKNESKNQVSISKSSQLSTAGDTYCNESHLSRMPWNLSARPFTGQVQRSEQTIKATGVC
jgi:hypothetical protein